LHHDSQRRQRRRRNHDVGRGRLGLDHLHERDLDDETVRRRPGDASRPPSGEPSPGRISPAQDRPQLVDRIGAPVRSRLDEMCEPIRMNGEDYRQKKKPSSSSRLR